jgi:hypothetical protein
MSNENESPIVPVSNWTLATGTRPGERPITVVGPSRPVPAPLKGTDQ